MIDSKLTPLALYGIGFISLVIGIALIREGILKKSNTNFRNILNLILGFGCVIFTISWIVTPIKTIYCSFWVFEKLIKSIVGGLILIAFGLYQFYEMKVESISSYTDTYIKGLVAAIGSVFLGFFVIYLRIKG